jgi:hypothetical protein
MDLLVVAQMSEAELMAKSQTLKLKSKITILSKHLS